MKFIRTFTFSYAWEINEGLRNSEDEKAFENLHLHVVHIYTIEYYSAIKKNEIMPIAATWMDVEISLLSEVSQKEKDKYHMISLICEI